MAITITSDNIISSDLLNIRPNGVQYPLYYHANGTRYSSLTPAFTASGQGGWLYGGQIGNGAEWGSIFSWNSIQQGAGSYGFNNSQGRFYAPVTGRYYFYASTYFYNDNNSYSYIHFMFGKNGSISFNNGRSPYSIFGHGNNNNHADGVVHSTNVDLVQGQYMTIQTPWNVGTTRAYASHTLYCGALIG